MVKIKNMLDKVLSSICIIMFVFLVVLVTWQVFTRLVLNNPSTFSEELAKIVFVWLSLFGAAYVFGERGHMNISFVRDKMSPKVGFVVDIIVEITIFLFASLVLVYGGYLQSVKSMSQSSPALPVSVGQIYLALPISGLIIMFYSIYNIYDFFKKNKSKE